MNRNLLDKKAVPITQVKEKQKASASPPNRAGEGGVVDLSGEHAATSLGIHDQRSPMPLFFFAAQKLT